MRKLMKRKLWILPWVRFKIWVSKTSKDLESFRVKFDVWFSETSLYKNGKIDQALAVLKERDEIFEEDGATWFRSMTYGDDKTVY